MGPSVHLAFGTQTLGIAAEAKLSEAGALLSGLIASGSVVVRFMAKVSQ